MKQSLYEYNDYKAFVLDQIEARPAKGRGVRRLLADAMGCQAAYVSHVLAGERHFSLEQAERVTSFFGLSNEEAEYFLLLVQAAKAGTTALRRLLAMQIEKRRDEYREIKSRIKVRETVSTQDQAQYYSSWHYQAIRMALTIPECRKPQKIAERLGLPLARVREVLDFFVERGLAKRDGENFLTTNKHVHLKKDSPYIERLHSNWRVHTLQTLEKRNPEDLHYSSVVTISKADFDTIREIMLRALADAHRVIGPSKEEKLCTLAMDFYEL
jgi:uncharacterized protein (TIGR02147 family)